MAGAESQVAWRVTLGSGRSDAWFNRVSGSEGVPAAPADVLRDVATSPDSVCLSVCLSCFVWSRGRSAAALKFALLVVL